MGSDIYLLFPIRRDWQNSSLTVFSSFITKTNEIKTILNTPLTHCFLLLKNFHKYGMFGGGNSRFFFRIHDLANNLNPKLLNVLISAKSISGAGALSKVGTKKAAVREVQANPELLAGFGHGPLTEYSINCS